MTDTAVPSNDEIGDGFVDTGLALQGAANEGIDLRN